MRPVLILCGGKGERLRAVIDDRPKVLADISGACFLGLLLDRLIENGAREILLSTGYKAGMIEDYVSEHGEWGARVRTIAEESPLGTAGAIRFASSRFEADASFFVLNGDTWFDADLASLSDHHESSDAAATIALAAVEDASRYGRVEFDDGSGAVTSFQEKRENAGPAWINGGIYLLEPTVLAGLKPGQPCSLERDIFPALIGNGLYALPFDHASFLDIGTPADYARAQTLLGEGP
jgi:NDP-sugar pyrophosphorylase family protein